MKVRNILITLVAFFLVSCAPEPIRVVSVTLNIKSITLEIGKTERLIASISPNNADNIQVIWVSDDASVAKVSNDGSVTAIAPGSAKITARTDDGGLSDVCVVNVPNPFVFVTEVKLEETDIPLFAGEQKQLHATVLPADADNPALQWSCNNKEVAHVSSDGLLQALKPGTADITVTSMDGGKTAKCKVTVRERVVDFRLEPEKEELYVDDEMDIKAILDPEDSKVNLVFKSDSPDVVSVEKTDDVTCHIKALSAGNASVAASSASDEGIIRFSKFLVRNRIQSVEITASPTQKNINVGETLKLNATILPTTLKKEDILCKWESSNSNVATVDSLSGIVTAKSRGIVTFTVTVKNGPKDKKKSDEYTINVIQPVNSISVEPSSLEMIVGDEKSFKVNILPDNADNKKYSTKISPEGFVEISDGKIRALKDGPPVKVIFIPENPSSKNLQAELNITVGAQVADIDITGNKEIHVGEKLQLKAVVKPNEAKNKEVTWTSSKTNVATIDEDGIVTALKAGKTTITAQSVQNPEVKKTCTVVVNDIPIDRVELNKTSLDLVEGDTNTELKATVYPANPNLNRNVEWSSSNDKVATVSVNNNTVTITAIASGKTFMTATSQADKSKSDTCIVTVSSKIVAVQNVKLNETSMELEIGKSKTLTATIEPLNATNKNVSWTSSNMNVATVDNGKIKAIAPGKATITVTTADGGKTASCDVNVPQPPVPVAAISLSTESATLTFGQSLIVDVTVLPEDASDPSWECFSSDESIASVSKSGSKATITAKNKEGKDIKITFKSIKYPSISKALSLSVKANIILVSSITIEPSRLDLYVGQEAKITATVLPVNADNKNIKWSVPQGAVTTNVDSDGFVKAIKVGESRIMADSQDGSNIRSYIWVYVTKNLVDNISLSKTELILKEGETYDLQEKVTAKDPKFPASNPTVSWKSSSKNVATVSSSGKVTAVKAGETIVTVTSLDDSSKKATCKITVLSGSTGGGGIEGINFDDWTFD